MHPVHCPNFVYFFYCYPYYTQFIYLFVFGYDFSMVITIDLVSSITNFSVLQYVSRSSTAPGGFGGITGLAGISQLGAPSPPPTRYYMYA